MSFGWQKASPAICLIDKESEICITPVLSMQFGLPSTIAKTTCDDRKASLTWLVRSRSVKLWPVALSVALTRRSTKLPGVTPRRSPVVSAKLALTLPKPFATRFCTIAHPLISRHSHITEKTCIMECGEAANTVE